MTCSSLWAGPCCLKALAYAVPFAKNALSASSNSSPTSTSPAVFWLRPEFLPVGLDEDKASEVLGLQVFERSWLSATDLTG